MTDRELLEMAAKAIGLDAEWAIDHWNPLAEDGDALRLAVKLRLEIDTEHDPVCVGHFGRNIGVREPFGLDVYSATRRAIVRAAAAMA